MNGRQSKKVERQDPLNGHSRKLVLYNNIIICDRYIFQGGENSKVWLKC